mmetsp:Transcript_12087/g.18004  ORF Transcript_12087/g.18004 Transcript_12087/m.18004 type:complete len:558 (+) Transcript_12087:87-1760(+)
MSKKSKKGEEASVKVVLRIRPLNGLEKKTGQIPAWGYRSNQIYLTATPKGNKKKVSKFKDSFFALDRIFPPTTTNDQIFTGVGKPMIDGVMKGFHGCIFAYGQTSSGKTHTIHGSPEQPGVVPQSVQYIFDYIENHPGKEYVLRVSYIEIYNEIINDLLNPSGTRLRVRESKEKGVFVDGLKEEVVMSCQQVLALIAAGESHRHIGRTNYNAVSSRSHTLFRLTVESSGKRSKTSRKARILTSTLNIVDLAGSENAVKAGSNKRIKETGYINKSLLTLGHVIFKLSEKGKGHIPYRNSKLTRVLQNSLSGKALVAICCCLSPSSGNIEESIQTLKFASRAKKIKNTVSANEREDAETLLERYREEIETLKKDLAIAKAKAQNESKNKVDKQVLEKLKENVENYKQQLQKMKRLILTSTKEEVEQMKRRGSMSSGGIGGLVTMDANSDAKGNVALMKMKRQKFFTLPRTFFMDNPNGDDLTADFTKSDALLEMEGLENFDVREEIKAEDGALKASIKFEEMQRELENLKQELKNKDAELKTAIKENKRLKRDIRERVS